MFSFILKMTRSSSVCHSLLQITLSIYTTVLSIHSFSITASPAQKGYSGDGAFCQLEIGVVTWTSCQFIVHMDKQPFRLTLKPADNIESSTNLTSTSLDSGSKPQNLERTHKDTRSWESNVQPLGCHLCEVLLQTKPYLVFIYQTPFTLFFSRGVCPWKYINVWLWWTDTQLLLQETNTVCTRALTVPCFKIRKINAEWPPASLWIHVIYHLLLRRLLHLNSAASKYVYAHVWKLHFPLSPLTPVAMFILFWLSGSRTG